MNNMHYLCGCSYTSTHRTKFHLPQVQLDAHTTILSNTSRTTLKQTFLNPTDDAIKQCIYTFPMYDGVSVVGFTCRIGSRVLRGLVKERSQAKATYDAAVSRGETAGLLEQLPEASDVFSTRLGNIPANEKIHVEITYVGELKHDAEADGIRFTLPTRIAPRYGRQPTVGPGSPVQADGGVQITVDIAMAPGSFVRGVQSPTHPIAVTLGSTSTPGDSNPANHQASSTLSLGSTELDKDFVLIVLVKETGNPKALVETHDTIQNQRAMLLTLVPKFSLPPAHPEIVLVADRSGSMEHQIPTLKSALKVFVKSLPVGTKFNICSFGSDSSFLWPKSQAYNRDSVNEALAHIDTFAANFGGTQTYRALKNTVDNRFGDISCEVMLLTDGDIWGQSSLFTYLNNAIRKSEAGLRVFALGIGDSVSHALIEGVARAGNGFAQSVNDNEKLDSKVIRMLKGGLSPHTTDYSLEVKYDDPDEAFEVVEKVTDALKVMLSEEKQENKQEKKPISFFNTDFIQPSPEKPPSADNDSTDPFAHLPVIAVPKVLQTPQTIPSLFPFSRSSVYLIFTGESAKRIPKSVTLRAKSQHRPLELEIPVEILEKPGQTLHQLAARKALQELEEDRGWIHEAKDDSENLLKERYPSTFPEMVQREAVRIGVQYQVGSKFCSFVAVEDNDKTQKPDDGSTSRSGTAIMTPASECAYDPTIEADSDDYGDAGFSLCDDGPSPAGNSRGSFPSGAQPQLYHDPSSYGRSGSASSYGPSGGAMANHPVDVVNTIHCYRAPSGASTHLHEASKAPTSASRSRTSGTRARRSQKASLSQPHSLLPGTYLRELAALSGQSKQNPSLAQRAYKRLRGGGPSSAVSPQRGPQTDNEKVHAVMEVQDFDGWWAYSQELMAILGAERVDASKEKAWITMLVVRWLETKMAGEEEVWELVVQKARGWLGSVYPGDQISRLEEEVVAFL